MTRLRPLGFCTVATAVLLLGVGAAQAASVTVAVTGSWDGLRSWNPGQSGGKVVSTTAGGGPEMAVSGSLTYDNVTGIATALSLTGETSIRQWDAGFNNVRLAGYSWTSSGTNLLLNPGATIGCDVLGNGVFVAGGVPPAVPAISTVNTRSTSW